MITRYKIALKKSLHQFLSNELIGSPFISTSAGNTRCLSKKYKPAAVIALIYPKNGEHNLLLTKRSNTLELHPGEISFPGGRENTTDLDLKDTALRECEEEVGIHRDQIKIISELGSFITNSNFEIFAFIATSTREIEFRINRDEVAQIIEFPLSKLTKAKCIRDDLWVVNGKTRYKPSFGYKGHLIFGATARILDCLVQTLPNTPYNS